MVEKNWALWAQEEWEDFKAFLASLPQECYGSPQRYQLGELSPVFRVIFTSSPALRAWLEDMRAAEQAALQARIKRALWEQGRLWWQGVLKLCVLKGAQPWVATLTLEEWESRQVNPQRGLKGSPKLSKQLVAAGCPAKDVELLLSVRKESLESPAGNAYVAPFEERYIRDQGNSRHFRSCQATDSRALWDGGDAYQRVDEDVPWYGTGLFMWVVGRGMCDGDPEGWIARAKLRVLTTRPVTLPELQDALTQGEGESLVAGLYIDRPYGDKQKLLEGLDALEHWWGDWCLQWGITPSKPLLIAPVWERDEGGGQDLQDRFGGRCKPVYCPSAVDGYQDTLTRGVGPYTFMVRAKTGFLARAYQARHREGGVRIGWLKDVSFNPQSNNFKVPPVSRGARPRLIWLNRELAEFAARMLGPYDCHTIDPWHAGVCVRKAGLILEVRKDQWGQPYVAVANGDDRTVVLRREWDRVFVESDCPQLGLWAAVPLP